MQRIRVWEPLGEGVGHRQVGWEDRSQDNPETRRWKEASRGPCQPFYFPGVRGLPLLLLINTRYLVKYKKPAVTL